MAHHGVMHAGRRSAAVVVFGAVLLGAAGSTAFAQDSVSETLSFLLTNQSVTTGDFVKDREAAAATRDTISRMLLVDLATLPIGSSAGGFVYRFNPTLGSIERVTDSFGPILLNRTLTSGRGQKSVGINYRYARFDALDGRPLRDGTLVTTANRFTDEPEAFDVETVTLDISAHTTTFFGSYGVTDRLDIEAAVPVVRLTLEGERLNVYRGDVFLQASASSVVTGLADVLIRAKYAAWQAPDVGLGVHVDVRLPTGEEANLLGAGRAAFRVKAVASAERGRVGSHLEIGGVAGGAAEEFQFGGAIVLAATPQLSLVGELIGRRLDTSMHISDVAAAHPQIAGVETTRLLPQTTGTTTMTALAGFKWNVGRTWLLNASVLIPMTDAGLTARATPSIALDYTFD
jgi:hypothetical protein